MLLVGLRLIPLILFTLVAMPFQMLAVKYRWRLAGIIPVIFHRLALFALRAHLKIEGAPSTRRPLLLVSNHISWMDIGVLGSLFPLSFVAKSEVGTWPIFSTLSNLQRSVYVERQSRTKAAQTASEMAVRLTDGDPIVLFAEGTSTDGATVLPLKSALIGAARQAIASSDTAEVQIQPVAICYTHFHGLPVGRNDRHRFAWIGDMDLLPHLKAALRDGGLEVTVAFLDPMPFDSSTDRKAVTRALEEAIRNKVVALNRR